MCDNFTLEPCENDEVYTGIIEQDSTDLVTFNDGILYLESIKYDGIKSYTCECPLLREVSSSKKVYSIASDDIDNILSIIDINLKDIDITVENNEVYFSYDRNKYTLDELLENPERCEDCGVPCEGTHCDRCLEHYFTCDHCGDLVHEDDSTFHEDACYCESCDARYIVTCDHCGDLEHRDNVHHTSGSSVVCTSCYENHYFYCENCNEIYSNDNYCDNGCCEACCREHNKDQLHNYSYRPSPIFHGSGLFFGLEIEVEPKQEKNQSDIVDALQNYDDTENYFYMKEDGSLSDGVEIVTHPCGIEYHEKNLKSMVESLHGIALSHDTSTCGLHIHIGREVLNNMSTIDRDTIENRLIYLYEKFFPQFLKFSRRTEEKLEHWAGRYLNKHEDLTIEQVNTKKQTNSSRYKAINLQPRNTIEFRLFRGTLDYSTIMASIELVRNVCTIATDATINIENVTWFNIINHIASPYIQQYKNKGE